MDYINMDYKNMDYKERLEKAKELYPTANADQRYVLESLFPELAENRDERILEIIKHCIESRYLHTSTIKGISQKECFAWLEKQKVTDEEIIFRPVVGTDIRIAAKQALEKIDIGKKVVLAFNGAYIPVNGKTVGEIDSEYDAWIEKQGEQNLANSAKTCKKSQRMISAKAKEALYTKTEDTLLDKALDFIVETQEDNDYICEKMSELDEWEYCENNCQNLNKECIKRFLKHYEKSE